MGIYERKLAAAIRVIERYTPDGNNAVWHKASKPVSDPDRPWDQDVLTTETFNCRIVFIESRDREKEFYFREFLENTDISKFKTFGIFYPQEFEPVENLDFVTNTAGDKFTCQFVRKYAPERITLLYIVGLN